MSIRIPVLRAFLLVVVLALVGAACTGGDDLEDLQREVEREGGGGATAPEEVEPPPAADPSRTGRVGIIIQTNSRTWGELLGAAGGDGVVAVFIQPDAPADGSGLEAGDLITAVDDTPVTNAEHAAHGVLRSQPGQERVLSVTKSDGSETEITITAEEPGDVDQIATYSAALEANAEDPVLHYLRGQEIALRDFEAALADIRRALELQPEFVEAIEVRANLRWTAARALRRQAQENPETEATMQELQEQAMADWTLALRLDPQNVAALAHRSRALAEQGQASSAKEDAEKAVAADETMPEAQYALGLSHFAAREYESGLVPARRAAGLNPYRLEYYELLAQLFNRLERPEDARATVDAIIDLVEDQGQREALLRIVEGN